MFHRLVRQKSDATTAGPVRRRKRAGARARMDARPDCRAPVMAR